MKFLIENELEKRHKKHKKTIKPGAMGSFIHPDGGNQVAIDTFNNSVDMGAVSCDAMSEELNEDYAANKLMKLISIQYPVEKDDNIQLFTTPRGNYLVKVNGKSLLTLGKENFRESDIENLRLDGYFTDYDELRMNGDLDESIETYINKEDKVTKSKFLKEFKDYPVGTYIRLCAKGNINDISQYTYGKVKTKDNEWAAYSSFYGIQDTTCDDRHIIDLIDKKNIKNIGVKLPKQPQARMNESLQEEVEEDNMNSIKEKVIKAIQDEWKTIAYYNDLIEELKKIDDLDGINVINDINNEEHIHVGQLQSLLQTMGGDIEAIHQGNEEGDDQLSLSESFDDAVVEKYFKQAKDYLINHPYAKGSDTEEVAEEICANVFDEDYYNCADELSYACYSAAADYLEESLKQPIKEELDKEEIEKINIFIEESRGYSDYNQIIEDVADEFDISNEEAERYVWNYMYQLGHSAENAYNESLNHKHYTRDELKKKGKDCYSVIKDLDFASISFDPKSSNIVTLYDEAGNKIRTIWWNLFSGKYGPVNEDMRNDLTTNALYALRNFKKHAQNGDELKIDINGNKGEVSKEADGWYLYYGGLVTQGSYKIIEATIKDILDRNSEKDIFLSEDYSKEEKRSDFIKALKLCAAYDPNTLYIDNYSQKQAAEAKNKEINTAFDKIMMKYNVKSTGVPAECTNLKSESDYINKLKQYIAENRKVMKESFDPYSIEYWNYDPDEIEVGIEYCENNFIDPHSLNPTDFENIVILANGYYPHNEGWKYTDAEILSALDYVLEKGMMLSSLTPENFEEIIKKANELDECAKMTNKEIKESLNKLDMWAIDNDATFYDLKTLYEAFINPHSPIDQKKKDKIQKALNDPTMNRDTEKLQDYIAGILVRQDEALEETLDEEEDYFSKLQESAKKIIVPKPYNKYFEVYTDTSEDDDYKYGDKIDGYDCHFLAYLIPKDEDGEIYPILTDDPDYPVCELVGGRLIPVDL